MFDDGVFYRCMEDIKPEERDTFRASIHRRYRNFEASRLRAHHFNCKKLYNWATRGFPATMWTPGLCYVVFESNRGISDFVEIASRVIRLIDVASRTYNAIVASILCDPSVAVSFAVLLIQTRRRNLG
jgi:hypothetical protein